MTKTVDWYNKQFPPGKVVAVVKDDGNIVVSKIILPFSTISGRPVAWLQGFRSCFAADRVREISAKEPISLGDKGAIGRIILAPIMDALKLHLQDIPLKYGMTAEELITLCVQEIHSLQVQKERAVCGKAQNDQADLFDALIGGE
jgi:hypothetical protein